MSFAVRPDPAMLSEAEDDPSGTTQVAKVAAAGTVGALPGVVTSAAAIAAASKTAEIALKAILAILRAVLRAMRLRTRQVIEGSLQGRFEPGDVAEAMRIEEVYADEFAIRSEERVKMAMRAAMRLPTRQDELDRLTVELRQATEDDNVQRILDLARQRERLRFEDGIRERAVKALMRQERRYARQHSLAALGRAYAAADRQRLRKVSPEGAFYKSDPNVKDHTVGCLVMSGGGRGAAKFWPWVVLDRVHPPRHTGCPCRLYGLGEGRKMGLRPVFMSPGDAIAAAQGVLMESEQQTLAVLVELAGRGDEAAGAYLRLPPPMLEEATHTGCMVALYPDKAVAKALAVEGGEPVDDIHLTVAFLGKPPKELERLKRVVEGFAASTAPLTGEVSGTGKFTAGDEPVVYASADIPGLPSARERLVTSLKTAGFPPKADHGYTPHLTLAYDDREVDVPNRKLRFDRIALVAADERFDFPLGGKLEEAVFDETKHTRDLLGRFAKAIGKLTPRNQPGPTNLKLPDDTRIAREDDGSFRVARRGRTVRGLETAEDAARNALDRSARARDDDRALGGKERHKDFDAFLDVAPDDDPITPPANSRIPPGFTPPLPEAHRIFEEKVGEELDRLWAMTQPGSFQQTQNPSYSQSFGELVSRDPDIIARVGWAVEAAQGAAYGYLADQRVRIDTQIADLDQRANAVPYETWASNPAMRRQHEKDKAVLRKKKAQVESEHLREVFASVRPGFGEAQFNTGTTKDKKDDVKALMERVMATGVSETTPGGAKVERVELGSGQRHSRGWSGETYGVVVDNTIHPSHWTVDYSAEQVAARRKSNSTKASKRVEEASRWFPKEWVESSNKRGKIATKLAGKRGRGRYHPDRGMVEIRDSLSNAAHELMHHVERSHPGMGRAQQLMFDRRRLGQPTRKLKDIFPGDGYKDAEITYEDGYAHAYMGKVYPYPDTYELMTMGMEAVVAGRYDLSRDHDYRHWVHGMLAVL